MTGSNDRAAGYVYFVEAPEVNRIKIGWTAEPAFRVSNLRGSSPCSLQLLKVVAGGLSEEARWHRRSVDRPRLTFEVEPETRDELAAWAGEEGRPIGNLVRRLLAHVVSERRQQQTEHA
jgi:hypothetical protein